MECVALVSAVPGPVDFFDWNFFDWNKACKEKYGKAFEYYLEQVP